MAVRSTAPAQPQSFFEFVSQYPFESGEVDARLALEPVDAAGHRRAARGHAGGRAARRRARQAAARRPPGRLGADREGPLHLQRACTAARYELEIRKGGTEVGRMVLDIRGDGTA